MHAVIIDGDVSYPATSGKRLRTLNLMLQLAKRHQITYVGRCAADSEEASVAPSFLRAHGIEPILLSCPVPRKSGLKFYSRLVANLFSALPYSVVSHQSQAIRKQISKIATTNRVDVWQVEWAPYLSMIDRALKGPRVVIAHNVDTLIWQRYYENEHAILKKTFLKSQWKKFQRFEAKAFQSATRVVAVSEEDAQLIRDNFGQSAVDVVDNGIDRDFFAPIAAKRNPSQILFLGALDWRPNLDAVSLLLDRILPQVLRQKPDAKLIIVGRRPPTNLVERVRQLAAVELHADVGDVRPFLAQCSVMAVPLRIGGGSRLKILEALAAGLPVVSTRIGAEGLILKSGQDYIQAEIDEMPTALTQILHSPMVAQEMTAQARTFVLDRYDWSTLAAKLEATWERSVARLPAEGIFTS